MIRNWCFRCDLRTRIIDEAHGIRHAKIASDFHHIGGGKDITDVLDKLIEFEAFAVLENLIKSKSTLNHLFLIAVPILMFGVLGCDTDDVGDDVGVGDSYVPRVQLVKDGPNEFHFQWDEPLKEERIILCLVEEFLAITTTSPVIIGYKPTGFPFQRLVYFPEGSFISESIKHQPVFIEILPASERYKFPLPAKVFEQPGWGHKISYNIDYDEQRRILEEHPFKPYRVGKPSRITFEMPKLQGEQ